MSEASIRTGVVVDNRYMEHDPGSHHVESPERLRAIYKLFEESDFKNKFIPLSFEPFLPKSQDYYTPFSDQPNDSLTLDAAVSMIQPAK